MDKWAHIENIVLIVVFLAIIFALEGGAKAWALAPLLFMNYPIGKK